MNFVVTDVAQTRQVIQCQGKMRKRFDLFDMVDTLGGGVLPSGSVPGAFPSVTAQGNLPAVLPLTGLIELDQLAGSDIGQ